MPRKNLRALAGKPLLEWTIAAAQGSTRVDRIILSSEDPEIIELARALGCEVPFVRPLELAQDVTPAIDVVRHTMANLASRYDYFLLLQPTSPLRTSADIDGCIDLCEAQGASSAVSISEAPSPYWTYRMCVGARIEPLMSGARAARRQDVPDYYVLNGAVFLARWDWLERNDDFVGADTVGYVMPRERAIDIDDELDLMFASALLTAAA